MSLVFLFGNGLSVGFAPEFRVDRLTQYVIDHLDTPLKSALVELGELATPEDPEKPFAHGTLTFEQLAGALDRVAMAVQALKPLASASTSFHLQETYEELRSRYLSVVGLVLTRIDGLTKEVGKEDWSAINAFADALLTLRSKKSCVVFTVNYDTVLLSALLGSTKGSIYDGFIGGRLEHSFDPWAGKLPLYHLHGATLWVQGDGTRKLPTEDPRHGALLETWSKGEDVMGLPLVILGDQKTPQTDRPPFNQLYAEFRRCLLQSQRVIAGGYSFGDVPINRILGEWLADDQNRRIDVWIPEASEHLSVILERLRAAVQSSKGAAAIQSSQVIGKDVELPSASLVAEL